MNCGVSLLHHQDGLLPALQQALLACLDLLHLHLSLIQDLLGLLGLFLLRDDLSSEDVLLLLQPLAFLVHGVNQQILSLLDLLQVAHIVLRSEGFLLGDGDIRLELQIVVLDLVVVLHEVLELLLGLVCLALQHVGFFLLGLAELVDLGQFLL